MRYTYDLYRSSGVRFDTTTNINEINPDEHFSESPPGYIVVFDGLKNLSNRINNKAEFEEWYNKLERDYAWQPAKWDPFREHKELTKDTIDSQINPAHYKDIVPGMQYMEMMQYMLPDISSHLLGQVYKYLMRDGKKDNSLQERRKALWYLKFLVAYQLNDKKPIKISDINKIIGEG